LREADAWGVYVKFSGNLENSSSHSASRYFHISLKKTANVTIRDGRRQTPPPQKRLMLIFVLSFIALLAK